jgi:ribosomal protein L11 methyltransferase
VREIVLRVPRLAVEDVLDRLLPSVPQGVREVRVGRDVELRIRGRELPSLGEISSAAGRWPHRLTEHEVPGDWRARRRLDWRPDLIGGRLIVRPEWAPQAPRGRHDLIEIVLAENAAFGSGVHPTTRTCLESLLELEPRGAFADLGCGTGVLAIVAARLGWGPVVAVDRDPVSVEAARRNAGANHVRVEARAADLVGQDPPRADGFAANVPAALHLRIARSMTLGGVAVVSGFGPAEADAVLAAYAAAGLRDRRLVHAHGWVVAVLEGGVGDPHLQRRRSGTPPPESFT